VVSFHHVEKERRDDKCSKEVQFTFQILDIVALHPKLAKGFIDARYHTAENVHWVLFNPSKKSRNPGPMSVLFSPWPKKQRVKRELCNCLSNRLYLPWVWKDLAVLELMSNDKAALVVKDQEAR